MIIIRPEAGGDPLMEQVRTCLDKLLSQCAGMNLPAGSIYKAILYLNPARFEQTGDTLNEIAEQVRRTLRRDMVVVLLQQPPVQVDVVMEAFYCNLSAWDYYYQVTPSGEAVVLSRDGVGISTGFCVATDGACRVNVVNAFSGLEELLLHTGFSMGNIVRQWNYIEDILGYEGPFQHYQLFNEARTKFYSDQFRERGYPAGTGIGTSGGGIMIEYIAVSDTGTETAPIDNPEQVPAYQYQQDLLKGEPVDRIKSTPKFERGRYLSAAGKEVIFVSGTAAIRGQHVVYPENPDLQTLYTIDNIEQLINKDNLGKNGMGTGNFTFNYLRVYLKDRNDYPVVSKYCHEKYGNVPAVWIEADICRDELMVEIEGFLIRQTY